MELWLFANLLALKWRNYPGLPGWDLKIIKESLGLKEGGEKVCISGMLMGRTRLATASSMEKGSHKSRNVGRFLEIGKGKKIDMSSGAPGGAQFCQHLEFSSVTDVGLMTGRIVR